MRVSSLLCFLWDKSFTLIPNSLEDQWIAPQSFKRPSLAHTTVSGATVNIVLRSMGVITTAPSKVSFGLMFFTIKFALEATYISPISISPILNENQITDNSIT